MNNLVMKEVNFYGDVLVAGQNKDNEKIYVGVSWICNGLGFTKSQKDSQVQKIQTDLVLKQGCLKFQAGVFDENNEVVALELEFLPLWLAKITLTPKMQQEQPFIVEKLIKYQLEAKDVLAKAFIKNNELSKELMFLQGMLNEIIETNLKVKELETKSEITNNKVVNLETEFNKETVLEGFKTNDNLARKFSLYSLKDRPHATFIDAIAKHLKIYNTTIGYKDEYVNVVRETVHGGQVGISVYYSDKAEELIKEFINDKFKLVIYLYVKGNKKGQFKESGFVLGNSTYKFNEKTYETYKGE